MGSISVPTIAAVGAEAAADGAAAGAASAAAASSVAAYGSAAAITAEAAGTAGAAAAAGGSVFTLGNAAAIAGLVGSGASAYGAHQQGVAAANADKQKARVEALSAGQKQIDMRQRMLSALASQNAGAGAGGGSLNKANTMRQITQNQNDLMANKANASAQISLLDQGAANAGAGGNIAAGGDLVGGAAGFLKNINGG